MNKGITVYCASSNKIDEAYISMAEELGREIARLGVPLVTGGGRVGLMGAVNRGCLEAGGEAIGVIPGFMVERGWENRSLTDLRIVPDMHSRKSLMAQLSFASIALPGGIGTFEEFLEIITWRQLGLYSGRVVLLNAFHYYDPLLAMLDQASRQGFMRNGDFELFRVADTVAEAIGMLGKYNPPVSATDL